MDFYTNCFIPSLNEEIEVNMLTFGDYFQLNSYIKNSDYIRTNDFFNKICKKSLNTEDNITNLDKFVLLLHLKNVFLDPILKLSAKDIESNNISYEVILSDIINITKKYKIDNYKLPKNLFYSNVESIVYETGNSIDEIKKHINKNKILLFEVPDMIKGIPKVYLNCFDNTLFYFCKLLYSSDLSFFYKKIKILKKDFNFLLSEIYDMNPKELDAFLNTK